MARMAEVSSSTDSGTVPILRPGLQQRPSQASLAEQSPRLANRVMTKGHDTDALPVVNPLQSCTGLQAICLPYRGGHNGLSPDCQGCGLVNIPPVSQRIKEHDHTRHSTDHKTIMALRLAPPELLAAASNGRRPVRRAGPAEHPDRRRSETNGQRPLIFVVPHILVPIFVDMDRDKDCRTLQFRAPSSAFHCSP